LDVAAELMGVASGDDDMVAIRPTAGAKVGAAFMAGAGVLGLVLALQGFVFLQLRGVYALSEPIFAALGALGIFAAARLASMRGLGALLAVIGGGLLSLAALIWFVVAMLGGVFILLAIALVPIAGIAAGLGAANLQTARKADAARSRLRAQGLDAGF
jgi:hypothetical protein